MTLLDAQTALSFSMAANPGIYALLVGSGASRAAQIPTGWEIVIDLVARLAAAEGQTPADPALWYQAKHGRPPEYSSLVEALATTPAERRSLIHDYIEPLATDPDKTRRRPTAAHRAVARLVRDGVVRVIITTNFDRLLETALKEEGVEPVVVSSADGVLGMEPLVHQRCLVIKVHGDYLDTRILNTDGELADYDPSLNALLDRVFDEYGLLVCGWSGDWDPALRAAIQRAPSRRYPMFWASRREPAGLAADLLTGRAGRWVPIETADVFFHELQASIETQRRMARPHPLSVDILAAQTKKLLSFPSPRVELGDLLQTEARTANALLQAAEVYGQRVIAPTRDEEFTRRVDVFEGALERLVRLFYLIGRWDSGDEDREVARLIRAFNRNELQSGSVLWIALGGYPAVLLWYAYGLGATKCGRLAAVYRWLNLPFPNRYGEGDTPSVREFLHWEYDGSREGDWAGRLQSQTRNPFADYVRFWLHGVLISEFISSADFDEVFERFELLATLRHLEDGVTVEALKEAPQRGRPSIPSPIGRMRVVGFGQTPPAIAALKRDEELERLAEAGFGREDAEWLALALNRISDVVTDPFGR
ncbi:hypothetical protein D3C71_489310 [compost metagenome]